MIAERSVLRNGNPIALTRMEWLLLDTLLKAEGQPVSPGDLLQASLGPAYVHDEAYLAVAVWRLRHKLEAEPAHPRVLRSAAGGGYYLAAPEHPPADQARPDDGVPERRGAPWNQGPPS